MPLLKRKKTPGSLVFAGISLTLYRKLQMFSEKTSRCRCRNFANDLSIEYTRNYTWATTQASISYQLPNLQALPNPHLNNNISRTRYFLFMEFTEYISCRRKCILTAVCIIHFRVVLLFRNHCQQPSGFPKFKDSNLLPFGVEIQGLLKITERSLVDTSLFYCSLPLT